MQQDCSILRTNSDKEGHKKNKKKAEIPDVVPLIPPFFRQCQQGDFCAIEVSADDIKGIVVGVLQDAMVIWSMVLEMLGKPLNLMVDTPFSHETCRFRRGIPGIFGQTHIEYHTESYFWLISHHVPTNRKWSIMLP